MIFYEGLSSLARKWLVFICSAAFLITFIGISLFSKPLTNPAVPAGILSFEMAGSPEESLRILHSWSESDRRFAAFSLGFDYLFMVMYASLLSLACLASGKALSARKWPFARWANFMAVTAWAAALLDALENLALAKILFGAEGSPWPEAARLCAAGKFALLFAVLVVVFYGLAVSLA